MPPTPSSVRSGPRVGRPHHDDTLDRAAGLVARHGLPRTRLDRIAHSVAPSGTATAYAVDDVPGDLAASSWFDRQEAC